MPSITPLAPTLQIQSVLYQHGQASVERSIGAVVHSARRARAAGAVGRVSLVLGDCSPERTLSIQRVDELRRTLATGGIDELSYEFFGENLGSAAGHNRLLTGLDSDLVMLINPDAVASPFLISELVSRLDDDRIGQVEARQLPLEHPKAYDLVTGETSWASTACVLMPSRVVAKVGQFDSATFFLYCDDVDYSWRVRLAGYTVVFHPRAYVLHDKRVLPDGGVVIGEAEQYYGAEAILLMTHKWSRPDLVETFLGEYEAVGTPLQRKAAAAFRERRRLQSLPGPVDPHHVVGQFYGCNWARHRW